MRKVVEKPIQNLPKAIQIRGTTKRNLQKTSRKSKMAQDVCHKAQKCGEVVRNDPRNTPRGIRSPSRIKFGIPRDPPGTFPGQPTHPHPGRPWGRNIRKGCPLLSCPGMGCDDCVGWARLLGWARLGSPSLTRRQVGGFY